MYQLKQGFPIRLEYELKFAYKGDSLERQQQEQITMPKSQPQYDGVGCINNLSSMVVHIDPLVLKIWYQHQINYTQNWYPTRL